MNKIQPQKIKVALGMSGGVDSAVAAALLKEQGYDVIGVFLQFWKDSSYTGDNNVANKCCSVESLMDARRVAAVLDIPLITINLSLPFKEFVVNNFLEEYEEGRTPNPCVVCNQFVKMTQFYEEAKKLGCEFIATGHYAQIKNGELYESVDKNKDQTYFLHKVPAEVLAKTIFPIGHLTKPEVRKLAEKFNLPVAHKKDSNEISFVPDLDHNEFLKRHIKLRAGDIVDTEGKKIGEHQGLALFTNGQRHGVPTTQSGHGPWFVVGKDFKKNLLIVTNDTNYPGLFKTSVTINKAIWINAAPEENKTYGVKLRYRQKASLAKIKKSGEDYVLEFEEPQRAVTPGQSAVVYEGERVIGGGVITQ